MRLKGNRPSPSEVHVNGNEESTQVETASIRRRKRAPITALESALVQDAKTKYHRLGDSNNRNVFSHSVEAGTPRSGRQLDLVLVRALPSWLVDSQLLVVSSHCQIRAPPL